MRKASALQARKPALTALNMVERQALILLRMDYPPESGLGGPIWGMDWAKNEYLDWLIIQELIRFEEVGVRELAESLGIRGTRVAGRMKALHKKRLVKKVKGHPCSIYVFGELAPSKRGQGWMLTDGAVNKLRRET